MKQSILQRTSLGATVAVANLAMTAVCSSGRMAIAKALKRKALRIAMNSGFVHRPLSLRCRSDSKPFQWDRAIVLFFALPSPRSGSGFVTSSAIHAGRAEAIISSRTALDWFQVHASQMNARFVIGRMGPLR